MGYYSDIALVIKQTDKDKFLEALKTFNRQQYRFVSRKDIR